jgi:hypothetical protein
VVVAILAAVVVGVALLVGWQMGRDPSPGRARESFLIGDESRYWCVDLKPDDLGLMALFARFDEINESSRRELVRGTFLESIPFPRRHARLADVAPLTIELSQTMSDPTLDLPVPTGWAARGTISRGMFKVRLALRMMRFFAARDPKAARAVDVDGVEVTSVRGRENVGFAFATVGNRVLVAHDASRLRAILSSAKGVEGSPHGGLIALHGEVALPGEDAWAFASNVRLPGISQPFVVAGAVASFDVNDRDELAFRVGVVDGGAIEESAPFTGSAADCAAVAASFLPGVPVAAIEIEGEGARPGTSGATQFSGRITGLSKRFAELVGSVSGPRWRERMRPTTEPEGPSATPSPPPPPPPSDRRTGTHGEPPNGGTPKPPR